MNINVARKACDAGRRVGLIFGIGCGLVALVFFNTWGGFVGCAIGVTINEVFFQIYLWHVEKKSNHKE